MILGIGCYEVGDEKKQRSSNNKIWYLRERPIAQKTNIPVSALAVGVDAWQRIGTPRRNDIGCGFAKDGICDIIVINEWREHRRSQQDSSAYHRHGDLNRC
jgi:hypothetical protein